MKPFPTKTFRLFAIISCGASLVASSCLEQNGTSPLPSSTSSSSGDVSSTSSSGSSGTSSASSSGVGGGNTGGAGGSGGVSSSSSASSSSGSGGPCDACNSGMMPACTPKNQGEDDCLIAGELCDGNGACACGISKPPLSVGTCPAPWVTDSATGTCLRVCGQTECKNAVLNCTSGFNCALECAAQSACEDATLNCPPGQSCHVSCTGKDGCKGLQVNCSADGPCGVNCDNSMGVCGGGMLVTCGNNECTAMCTGTKPMVIEGGSTTSCKLEPCP